MNVRRNLREKLSHSISTPSAIDLIDRLLTVDPTRRLTADQALAHAFFREDPPPGDLTCLSQNGASFLEYLSRQQNQQQQQQFQRYNQGVRGGAAGYRAGAGITAAAAAAHNPQESSSINFDRIY